MEFHNEKQVLQQRHQYLLVRMNLSQKTEYNRALLHHHVLLRFERSTYMYVCEICAVLQSWTIGLYEKMALTD